MALLAEPPGGDTHPEIAAAVRRAGDALAEAGYEVVEAEPPLYEAALEVWGRLLFIDIRAQEPVLRQVMGPDAVRFLDYVGMLFPPKDAAGRTRPSSNARESAAPGIGSCSSTRWSSARSGRSRPSRTAGTSRARRRRTPRCG